MAPEFRANYEKEPDKLMGFGSVFEKALIRPTFERFWAQGPMDRVTLREPGRIFTAMNQSRIKLVDVPVRNLPWATGADRLYRQSDHMLMAQEARLDCFQAISRYLQTQTTSP